MYTRALAPPVGRTQTLPQKMPQYRKVPYTSELAFDSGIHDFEWTEFTGDFDSDWIYYVTVCGFTFTFFSLDMIQEYLEYYSSKVVPNRPPFTIGPAASIGDGQTRFERLPAHLRRRGRRKKVVKALEQALLQFAPN